MNLSKFLSGIAILAIGLLLLLTNFGYVDSSAIFQLFKYWPAVLIIIGLSILFKTLPRPLETLLNSILSLAIIFGLAMFTVKIIGEKQGTWTPQETQKQLAEPFNEKAKDAQIDISTGASTFNIAGGSSLLVEGTIESIFSSPSISRKLLNSDRTDGISIKQNSQFWLPWNRSSRNNWNLKINSEIQTMLNITAGASKINVNLTDTNVSQLSINAGASKMDFDLGVKSPNLKTTIKAGASTINISVPKECGISTKLDTGMTSNNLEKQGLIKNETVFTTTDYDKAPTKIQIEIDAGASTINLQRY